MSNSKPSSEFINLINNVNDVIEIEIENNNDLSDELIDDINFEDDLLDDVDLCDDYIDQSTIELVNI